jgi:hypothetical protein
VLAVIGPADAWSRVELAQPDSRIGSHFRSRLTRFIPTAEVGFVGYVLNGPNLSLRQPISGVPGIRFSSWSVTRRVLASRVACFGYGHHIFVPAEPAFGGDDHRRCEENDYGAEDQESCCVRRRYHIIGELVD